MKKVIIAVFILLVVGGGVFAFTRKGSSEPAEIEDIPTPTVALPTISSDVEVDLTPVNGGKAVKLSIDNVPSDVDTIEYEISYMTGSGIPRGVLGKITTEGKKTISRDDITLGTCSSGHCVVDAGVTSVDLSLKFNTLDGPKVFRKSYSIQG
ncbi:hypothetical protein A3D77_02305 [Candidatus Gottesmanbacteria bacterium RIFCSPHIGHO2_02_FULL_39_11]|uniref:Uncharacterized protein n=1 Tax=Candidatus Gottesmanbacteria bacterium RIFCSPHIGHO2_02_FULL_39_11 TaxID=1798382 RepID=A0A1F5ZUX1_9BACT|nr:MAG: hypothetical protein A3D77_02305 [Candidatus Gottesmanbacteria bacterium RIFCSPHIGHO2_02_FULL_39_11]